MRTAILTTLIVCLSLLFSCDKAKQNEETNYTSKKLNTHKLIVKDTIKIELDSITSVNTRFSHQKIDGVSYLSMVNVDHPGFNIISIYESRNFKLLKKIMIDKQGPDAVGEITSEIYIHNWDSIFVLRYHSSNLFLVNEAGLVIKKYRLHEFEGNSKFFGFYATKGYPIYYNKGVICFEMVSTFPPHDKRHYSDKTEICIDLKMKKIANRIPDYPDFMQEGKFYGAFGYSTYRVVNKTEEFVYAYNYDPTIYVYKNEKLVNKIYAPLGKLNETPPPPNTDLSMAGYLEQAQYAYQYGRFSFLDYDRKNKIYIRFYLMPSNPKDINGEIIKLYDLPFIAQIFDSNFDVICEFEFTNNEYSLFNYVFYDGYLMLPNSNPKSQLYNEEVLSFTRYQLVANNN